MHEAARIHEFTGHGSEHVDRKGCGGCTLSGNGAGNIKFRVYAVAGAGEAMRYAARVDRLSRDLAFGRYAPRKSAGIGGSSGLGSVEDSD